MMHAMLLAVCACGWVLACLFAGLNLLRLTLSRDVCDAQTMHVMLFAVCACVWMFACLTAGLNLLRRTLSNDARDALHCVCARVDVCLFVCRSQLLPCILFIIMLAIATPCGFATPTMCACVISSHKEVTQRCRLGLFVLAVLSL